MDTWAWQPTNGCSILETISLLQASEEGALVDLYVGPSTRILGTFYKFRCSLALNGRPPQTWSSDVATGDECFGFIDYFGVGPMAAGWDEVAWASQGLPATGDLVFEFKMLKVW